jgi:hypothetical protein
MSSIGKDILDTIIGEALVSAHCEGVLVWNEDAEKVLSDKFEYLLDENIELHKHMDRLQKEIQKCKCQIDQQNPHASQRSAPE